MNRLTYEGNNLHIGKLFLGRPVLVALKGYLQKVNSGREYINFSQMSQLEEACQKHEFNLVMPDSGANWSKRDDRWLMGVFGDVLELAQASTLFLAGLSDGGTRARELAWKDPRVSAAIVWSGMFSKPKEKPRNVPLLLLSNVGEGMTARGTQKCVQYMEANKLTYQVWTPVVPSQYKIKHRWLPAMNDELLERLEELTPPSLFT